MREGKQGRICVKRRYGSEKKWGDRKNKNKKRR